MDELPGIEAWRARGRHVEVLGQRVFVVEAGPSEAPVVVITHGYPTSSLDYAGVLDTLSADHRVVVHDHLGFGLSAKPTDYSYSLFEQAEVALALWRSLGIEAAHLVAHDYGTSVATELVARQQRQGIGLTLRSLTLCNGSIHLDLARPRLIQRLLQHPGAGPWVAKLASFRTFRRNMTAILARPEAISPRTLQDMWALLIADGGRDVLPAITRYLDERVRFRSRWIGALTRLDRPTHVLWGEQDPVARVEVAHALASEIPSAQLTLLDGVGHYPMLEDPGRWSSALLRFLDQVR